MIEVEQLSKSYGPREAIKGLSFQVEKGEVVGFLGPNGAGKVNNNEHLILHYARLKWHSKNLWVRCL